MREDHKVTPYAKSRSRGRQDNRRKAAARMYFPCRRFSVHFHIKNEAGEVVGPTSFSPPVGSLCVVFLFVYKPKYKVDGNGPKAIILINTAGLTEDQKKWLTIILAKAVKHFPTILLLLYQNVGIRAKGNTSLSFVSALGSDRYSFKIEFDHYDSDKLSRPG